MSPSNWLDNATLVLRLVLENAFLMPEAEFVQLVAELFQRSKLSDMFATPQQVNKESLASRLRLIDKLQRSLQSTANRPQSITSATEDTTAVPIGFTELLEVASRLGYHDAVETVVHQRTESLIYVGGAGSGEREGSKAALAHVSAMEQFCSVQCLELSCFLQFDDWTDQQASTQLENWLESLTKSKQIIGVVGHSAGCEILIRNQTKLPHPLILMAPDLIGNAKIVGAKILLPSDEINEGSTRWGCANELYCLLESTHSMMDDEALRTLSEILESLFGVRIGDYE